MSDAAANDAKKEPQPRRFTPNPGIARYYSFEEICAASDCVDIAREIGLAVKEDRCPASWRGGTNETSVSLAKSGWHDFATGQSGSVIDLVALVMFAEDTQAAQQWLGDRLALTPKMTLGTDKAGRAERLEREGYSLVKAYPYIDPATGKARHTVERWEHPEKGKEFVQRAGSRYSLKGIETLLYRLPDWIKSPYVILCEGEKDADTVADALKMKATTNPAGAGRWEPHYNQWLAGKDVAIMVDNDDAGRARLAHLLWELKNVANNLKAIHFDDLPEKSDVTDCVAAHGANATIERIRAAEVIDKAAIVKPTDDLPAVTAAKEANRHDLRNFIEIKEVDDKGKTKVTHKPRQINDLMRDIRTRLLGFPHKVGDSLFDHDRDTAGISFLDNPAELFSWMATKTGRNIQWKRGEGMTPRDELFSGLRQTARRFESVSTMPHFPPRGDTYYSHAPLPPPSPDRECLQRLLEMFSPASPIHAILLKAFIAAPLFYIRHIPRPAWIIDSEDGAGTGKTTMVEAVAHLYGTEVIRTSKPEMLYSAGDVLKRCLSGAGRMKRVLLVDNVQGNFASASYADMVTASSLSGRPAYGRGEETRWNDLTYVITANSANVDNDIAQRSWTIMLRRSNIRPSWKADLTKFIDVNRLQIVADILDVLQANPPLTDQTSTRYPEFEQQVLQPMCGDMDEYSEAIKQVFSDQQTQNLEEDVAARISETIRHNLLNIGLAPDQETYFLRSEVIDAWFRNVPMPVQGDIKQQIVNAAKHGMLTEVDKTIRIWPNNGESRRRGFLWNRGKTAPRVLGVRQDGKVGQVV
jgi:hypothetical protein